MASTHLPSPYTTYVLCFLYHSDGNHILSLVFTCAHCSICYHYIIFWKKSYRNGNGLQQQQCIEKKVGNPVEYYWHYNMSIQLSLLPREQLHSISQIVNAHLRLVSRIARQFGNVRCFPMQKLLKSLLYAMYDLVWRLCWCSKLNTKVF